MSWQPLHPQPPSFDEALKSLELGSLTFSFRHYPAEQALRLGARIKLAAKLLTRVTDLQQSKALEAVSQALRFENWHQLSGHLARAECAGQGQLSEQWFGALACAALLMVTLQEDVAMPTVQLEAFEKFGQKLAMLTDAPLQAVLDGVCARLCAGQTWADVRRRSPLHATLPLYKFVVPDAELDPDRLGGYFNDSPACQALTAELDDIWQGYDNFSKPEKRKARAWVESALASQPGFLECGLALAWMQHDARQDDASSTVNRFIRQAEALIRKACGVFLAEPLVLRAEGELRTYWQGFWRKGAEAKGTLQGWHELADQWIDLLDEPSYEAALRRTGQAKLTPKLSLVLRARVS